MYSIKSLFDGSALRRRLTQDAVVEHISVRISLMQKAHLPCVLFVGGSGVRGLSQPSLTTTTQEAQYFILYFWLTVHAMEISEQTRTDVWQGWWDAARLTRYYQAVRDLHQRRHTVLVAAILLCGTGAMATLMASVPDWLQPVFGFAVAALSVWIAVSSYAVKAAMANTISIECQEIEHELSNLMALVDDPNNPPESEIRDCLVDLDARMDKATARAGYIGMTNNDKLNNRMAIEAGKVLEASYA